MDQESRRNWLALSLWEDLGPQKLNRIRMSVPEPWRVLDDPDLLNVIFTSKSQPGPPPAEALRAQADQLINLSEKGCFYILTIFDSEYPAMLADIHSPPSILYYQGEIQLLKRACLAIVGTRKPSRYGRDVTAQFAGALAEAGYVIVSGMAIGIDAIAHSAALDSNGTTIAVLGCGLDNHYPKSNAAIRNRIESSGCIVTEFQWGNCPNPGQFPRRNRIISGLSRGVLLIESSEKSGALITIRHAIEQNRDVFAVPGSVLSPQSRGPNRLLQSCGYPVLEPGDIVDYYSNRAPNLFADASDKSGDFDIEPELRPIWDLLDETPVSVDDLIAALRWEASDIQTALLRMELFGLIIQLPGPRYIRASGPSN